MSRSQEVNKLIRQQSLGLEHDRLAGAKALARSLATEVDALRADRDAYEARIAELERRLDAVVKLLEPGEKPKYPDARMAVWKRMRSLHARAVEIAEGREP